jgi:hypothetical protein
LTPNEAEVSVLVVVAEVKVEFKAAEPCTERVAVEKVVVILKYTVVVRNFDSVEVMPVVVAEESSV